MHEFHDFAQEATESTSQTKANTGELQVLIFILLPVNIKSL